MNLPSPIEAFFQANSRLDADAMLAPFAGDAIARDEGEIHRGAAAIGAWIRKSSVAVAAVAKPRSVESEGGSHRVAAEVSGNFPGSPIMLDFSFRLSGGRIAELEIG